MNMLILTVFNASEEFPWILNWFINNNRLEMKLIRFYKLKRPSVCLLYSFNLHNLMLFFLFASPCQAQLGFLVSSRVDCLYIYFVILLSWIFCTRGMMADAIVYFFVLFFILLGQEDIYAVTMVMGVANSVLVRA